jgi:hypothetical protein
MTSNSTPDKAAVVTGASSGIGAATFQRLGDALATGGRVGVEAGSDGVKIQLHGSSTMRLFTFSSPARSRPLPSRSPCRAVQWWIRGDHGCPGLASRRKL